MQVGQLLSGGALRLVSGREVTCTSVQGFTRSQKRKKKNLRCRHASRRAKAKAARRKEATTEETEERGNERLTPLLMSAGSTEVGIDLFAAETMASVTGRDNADLYASILPREDRGEASGEGWPLLRSARMIWAQIQAHSWPRRIS